MLTFVVQKHGGTIVAEISESTYAIIYPQENNSFERLREAVSHNKKIVTSKFVHDSCACGELMNASDPHYSLDGKKLRDRRGREILVRIAPDLLSLHHPFR